MNDLVYEMYKQTKKLIKAASDCAKGCEHSHEPLFKEWVKTIEILELANPDYSTRYEVEEGIRAENEEIAFTELKSQIVRLMHSFIEKYSNKDNPDSLYPKTPYILIDVLTSCLGEAQYQVRDYHPFTSKQRDHICYQIGDWYLMMKPLFEGTHNLGYMKEKLKIMICGD